MKLKHRTRTLALVLCTLFLVAILPDHAHAVTLTAVNETLLPLSDDTMPVRMGGELYAPYAVFDAVTDTATYDNGKVTLSSGENVLVFSPDEGTVYDQDYNAYETPAYHRNDTVYVPVQLVCGKLALGYSTLSVADETILRITDNTSVADDAVFMQRYAGEISGAIQNYYGGVVSSPAVTDMPTGDAPVEVAPPQTTEEETSTPPEVEEAPTQRSSRVHLCFYGETTKYTTDILDALQAQNQKATFFLPTDTESYDDDLLRRMVAEGHALGLLITAPQVETDVMTQSLTRANERFAFVTGIQTRLVTVDAGCDTLSAVQRNALIAAGYRMWDTNYDSQDTTLPSSESYAGTVDYLISTNVPVTIRLGHGEYTATVSGWLSSYLQRQGISAPVITLTATPMNLASDVR